MNSRIRGLVPMRGALSVRLVFIGILISNIVGFAGEIHIAADRGDVKAVKELLLKNPKLASKKDERGNAPLHIAASDGHIEVVKVLLENGADVHSENRTDMTPLHYAAYNGNMEIVKLLLEHGANPNAKAYKGVTPTDLAQRRGFAGIAALIRGKYEVFGSGFFITDDGYVVSNDHVIKNAVKVQVVTDSGSYEAKTILADETNDLALLKIESQSVALPILSSAKVVMGATVASVGFPLSTSENFSPKLSKGEIDSLSGLKDDPRAFQISLPMQPGNSGGALLDERGNVVGVVFSKINALAVLEATGILPENVNYAIKSDVMLRFLKAVPDVFGGMKVPKMDSEEFLEVVKSGENSAAQIHAFIELPWYHAAK